MKSTTTFCGNCMAVRPRGEFVRRPLPYAPNGRRFLMCWDVRGCEERASARGALYSFKRDGASVTPPGVALLAVLREAGRPVPSEYARRCVQTMLPDAAESDIARDVVHARASGLIVESCDVWQLGVGERVGGMLATMPPDGVHAKAARAAVLVVDGPTK